MRRKDDLEWKEYDIEPLYGQVSKIVDSARSNAFKQVNLLQILIIFWLENRLLKMSSKGMCVQNMGNRF